MKTIEISLPEYTVSVEPDYEVIGKSIDDQIKKYFMGRKILLRGIGSEEHPGKTIDELAKIISQTGTDRYDSERPGDRYENIEKKHIDLFAFPAKVEPSMELGRHMIFGFYSSAIAVHGRPTRIDILMIYDASQLEEVMHMYEGRKDIKRDGFVFKDPENKTAALLGIIKIQ